MTVLSPMREEVYEAYLQAAISSYADDNVAAGRWPVDSAWERSRADFQYSLPQGLATPNNYLFEIFAQSNGLPVGYLWFAEVTQHGLRSAYVYDLEIKPEHRRQGHAEAAFKALETLVANLGLNRIGLHVFGHNPGAQALYAKLGYGVTGINMAKALDGLTHKSKHT